MSEFREGVGEPAPIIVTFVSDTTEGEQIRVITDQGLPNKVRVQRVLVFPREQYGEKEIINEKIKGEQSFGEEDVRAGVDWLSKQDPYGNGGPNRSPNLGVVGVTLAKVDVALRVLGS